MGQLDTMPEAARQAAVADRLVVTKTDLADQDTLARLRRRLEALNPFAPCVTAVDGAIDPDQLANIGPRSVSARREEWNGWLGPVFREATSARRGGGPGPGVGKHDAAIRSFCLWFDKPFTWDGLNAALQALGQLRGPDLLRVKGIVHVAGEPGPIVLQGAQHLFHPPVTLEGGHDTDPRSRIVFVVRNMTRQSVEGLFAAVETLGATAD
jgi:G3E family GTPase